MQVAAALTKVAASVSVRSINGSALDALDYEQHRDTGLNIVAVGGDKLSRGLTLEGLTVSYFLRTSRMYDTLMQMGRWFGYKEKYLDVCRLFTTEDLYAWFQHIAAATEELRIEFDHMASVGATPKEYGLKVRSHPLMLVTSAVKMRSGTVLRLSYAGDISETIIFDTKRSYDRNLAAANQLLSAIGDPEADGGRVVDTSGAQLVLNGFLHFSVSMRRIRKRGGRIRDCSPDTSDAKTNKTNSCRGPSCSCRPDCRVHRTSQITLRAAVSAASSANRSVRKSTDATRSAGS